MKVNSLQNYELKNKNNTPQFKGSVSPEFIQYVNGIRKDCLKTATKQATPLINNVCDGILTKSNRVMEKYFHPLSVLTIDGKKYDNCDVLLVKNDIFTKLLGNSFDTLCIPKKERSSPVRRLRELTKAIISGSEFADAYCKDMYSARTAEYLLTHCDNYKGNEKMSSDVLDLLKFWEQHSTPLKSEVLSKDYDLAQIPNICSEIISNLIKH